MIFFIYKPAAKLSMVYQKPHQTYSDFKDMRELSIYYVYIMYIYTGGCVGAMATGLLNVEYVPWLLEMSKCAERFRVILILTRARRAPVVPQNCICALRSLLRYLTLNALYIKLFGPYSLQLCFIFLLAFVILKLLKEGIYKKF